MRKRTRAGAVIVALGMLGAVPAAADPAPGAPGLGDPIYPRAGNGGYDVQHYDIALRYQPATDELTGQTTLHAVATQDLSQFNLDFALKVTSVWVGGEPASFRVDTADKTELIVTPGAPVAKGRPLTVTVDYADIPSQVQVDGVQVWHRTETGGVSIGQPRSSETWFPANDHPSDKATYRVSATVPAGTTALSNGVLTGRSQPVPGWSRWDWRADEPMVSYLPFIALGKYEFTEGVAGNLPYYTAYDESLREVLPTAKAAIERTPEITGFLASKFGPYPFGSLGGVATTGWNSAIENQTRPVYGTLFEVGKDATWLVAHELAHQWYGDSVALADWSNMWLNEGFATYGEWLWSEHRGSGTAAELADAFYAKYPAEDAFWQLKLWPGTRLFASAVYERGAMTLQALRTEVGDDTFFRILEGYHSKYRGGHATTPDFIQFAEDLAGRPLDALFRTWLADPVKPATGPNGTAVTTARHLPVMDEMAHAHDHLAAHPH
ncbi:M1 family metallopeptidase [Saccharothrix sp. AJ9571]|nr:M1 family metallopeptidase [Saccharothrix sp. AJ9571]